MIPRAETLALPKKIGERLNKKQAKCVGRAEKQSPGADMSGMIFAFFVCLGEGALRGRKGQRECRIDYIHIQTYTHTHIYATYSL